MIPNPLVSRPFRVRRAAGTLALAMLVALSAGCGGKGDAKDATAQAAIPVEVAASLAPGRDRQLFRHGNARGGRRGPGRRQDERHHLEAPGRGGHATSRKASCSRSSTTTPCATSWLQAEATLKKAQAAFDKSEKGIAKSLIPRSDYDRDKFDLETQRAVVEGAKIELSYTHIVAPIPA